MSLFNDYLSRLDRRQASSSTVSNMDRTRALAEEAGLDLGEARDWQIEEFLASLPVSARTRRLHYQNLKAVYNYAVRRRTIDVSPMETVALPSEPDKEPVVLSRETLRTVLASCASDQDDVLANLLIYTGMRRDEVRMLNYHDVDLETSTITVRAGKGGKLRHIPIHPALRTVLSPSTGYVVRAGYGPCSTSTLQNRLVRIRGGTGACFHDFRRTVATSLAEEGVPERVIDQIMGWAPRTVGSRYYIRTAPAAAQEAIERLYGGAL